MFRGRKKLQQRDRESGLVFSWRLPLSRGGAMCLALSVVSGVSVLLGVGVQVHAGATPGAPGTQASLVILPTNSWGDWVERRAIEAGPFPVRWNPAASPEYAALRAEALRAASEPGPAPRPRLVAMDWDLHSERDTLAASELMQLPALPDAEGFLPDPERDPVVPITLHVMKRDDSMALTGRELTLDAETAAGEIGVRYLIEYDSLGRLLEITRLDSAEPLPTVVEWISKLRLRGHGGEPGAVVVETSVKR